MTGDPSRKLSKEPASNRSRRKCRTMMSRPVRRIATVLGVLIGIGLILPRLVNVDNLRPKLESELTAVLGRQVSRQPEPLNFLGSVSADTTRSLTTPPSARSRLSPRSPSGQPSKSRRSFSPKPCTSPALHFEEPQVLLLRGAGGTRGTSPASEVVPRRSPPLRRSRRADPTKRQAESLPSTS